MYVNKGNPFAHGNSDQLINEVIFLILHIHHIHLAEKNIFSFISLKARYIYLKISKEFSNFF